MFWFFYILVFIILYKPVLHNTISLAVSFKLYEVFNRGAVFYDGPSKYLLSLLLPDGRFPRAKYFEYFPIFAFFMMYRSFFAARFRFSFVFQKCEQPDGWGRTSPMVLPNLSSLKSLAFLTLKDFATFRPRNMTSRYRWTFIFFASSLPSRRSKKSPSPVPFLPGNSFSTFLRSKRQNNFSSGKPASLHSLVALRPSNTGPPSAAGAWPTNKASFTNFKWGEEAKVFFLYTFLQRLSGGTDFPIATPSYRLGPLSSYSHY